jgi:hypothetical protein
MSSIACGSETTPSESVAESSSPPISVTVESPSESAPIPEEGVPALLERLTGEVLQVVEPFAPDHKLTTDEERDAVLGEAADAIAALGFPVRKQQEDMRNYQQVVTFFEELRGGGDARVVILSVVGYESVAVNVTVYGQDEAGLFYHSASVEQNDELAWETFIYERSPLMMLELTPNGNLMYNQNESFEQGDGFGFRVIPQEQKYTDAYWKYVWPVDVQSAGVLSDSWNMQAGLDTLYWELIFEAFWQHENKQILVSEGSPYYTPITTEFGADQVAVVPADVVEGTLQRYFDVSADVLHEMHNPYDGTKRYDPETGAYTIWGFRGGGYKPTLEVSAITDNPDGSITLDIMNVALEFGDDGHVMSYLTVMPEPDGSFHYIGNQYSDWNIENKVSNSLRLAHSADLLHQGGFATLGDSVEQNGFRYAAVDDVALYERISLGGIMDVENLTGWFPVIFEQSAADKYVQEILDTQLYIDQEQDSEPVLYVNQDVTGNPIAAGTWSMDGFTVIENTPDRITVELGFGTASGMETRQLTLVPGERRSWILTDSYEGR